MTTPFLLMCINSWEIPSMLKVSSLCGIVLTCHPRLYDATSVDASPRSHANPVWNGDATDTTTTDGRYVCVC